MNKDERIVATTHPFESQQSDSEASDIQMSSDLFFGTVLTVSTIFFSIVWWIRGLSSKVENNTSSINNILGKCIHEHEKLDAFHENFKKDVHSDLKSEVQQSASDICHGFQVFAVEIRSDLKQINEKLDVYGKQIVSIEHTQEIQGTAIERIGNKMDALKEKVSEHEKKLENLPRRMFNL